VSDQRERLIGAGRFNAGSVSQPQSRSYFFKQSFVESSESQQCFSSEWPKMMKIGDSDIQASSEERNKLRATLFNQSFVESSESQQCFSSEYP
jgi:hypothetical protein